MLGPLDRHPPRPVLSRPPLRLPVQPDWLLGPGAAVLVFGACADLAYHLLPPDAAVPLAPLLGADGQRAHLITFIGMLIMTSGLIRLGLRR